MKEAMQPHPDEIKEAAKHPGGWVYRIAGTFGPDERIPPEAIVGAWKVALNGKIEASFTFNPKYDPARYPS
ncbi:MULTISPECIES: hypothetical protein [Nitrospirillum]|uniref:hypothetical protein n=1 Tax=Nitrospirillum amazonense TaxID=28077 RepID=UPI001FE62132|nr:hypothetical protein [Nitrospirillum amazonense]MEC4593236.1 hypothetical protein [Nitrospirillum amazonense]